MRTDVNSNATSLARVARHPLVHAAVRCALMCAIGMNTRRRAMKHDAECCA